LNTGGSWSDLHYKKELSFGQVEDKRRWVMWRSLLSKQEHLYLDFPPKIIHRAVGVGKELLYQTVFWCTCKRKGVGHECEKNQTIVPSLPFPVQISLSLFFMQTYHLLIDYLNSSLCLVAIITSLTKMSVPLRQRCCCLFTAESVCLLEQGQEQHTCSISVC